ncbi:transcriptional regulator [Kitasatospora kifunensis]|uniref:ParB-like chromosome segregation protein Spo0J n=1 Tax=Kitasatospora kifunensis TaxID=58351 RepID=A0A7W7R687_KITKI|nr:transcriptional regulator [Kitasatospora kifunensis]MBB4926192.1 ParB-like chromosome segregation protein Spo0J [Kitasatospora kifunensis]
MLPVGCAQRGTDAEAVTVVRAADVPPGNIVTVAISALLPGESPRSDGRDEEHIARLAELEAPLPPILVDRRSMRVIDGMHRVLAAVSKGQQTIRVEFFEGSSEDAFLRAVEANVSHGLPLSHADRRVAAERIVASHPHLSDRAIARSAGLGAKAVAAIRRSSTEVAGRLNARVGRDGKVRPLNSLEGRQKAAELLTEHPQASLREVARLAGISPATVSDVRRRLACGEPPAPAQPEPAVACEATVASEPAVACEPVVDPGPLKGADDCAAPTRSARQRAVRRMRLVRSDPAAVLEKLVRDPSLRHKEEGRQLLRLLQQNARDNREWSELTAVVPAHCGALVVDLARKCAETWLEFAQELDERMRSTGELAVAE